MIDAEHLKSVYSEHWDKYYAVRVLADEYKVSTRTIFKELKKNGIIGKGVVTVMSNPGDKKFFYTTKEIQLIKDMHAAGNTWAEISAATGRSVKKLQAKWTQLRKEENGEQPKQKEKKQAAPIPEAPSATLEVTADTAKALQKMHKNEAQDTTGEGYELEIRPKVIWCNDKEAVRYLLDQLRAVPVAFDYEVYAIKRERITLDGDDND